MPTEPLSHSSGGALIGSCVVGSVSTAANLMSSCPHIDILMGGHKVSCLLDTGSMVSTVTESFFFQHFKTGSLQACRWLQLKAANGLAIPYLGYLELDVFLCGRVIPGCGVLVVKDPPGGASVPGVLGMNVISKCYELLFFQHGPALFELPTVSQAPGHVFQALQQCYQAGVEPPPDVKNVVKLSQGRVQRIPGGVTKFVRATCSDHLSGSTALFEPLDSGLPGGLLASPSLVQVFGGTVYVPVVNVGTSDVLLYARTQLGYLHGVDVVSLPKGVAELRAIEVAGSSPSSVRSQIDALDLSDLSREEAQRVRTLLVEYQAVFSAHEGDLGCTSLISHEIPLLDDVPVRQRYRRLPPSEYEVVKAHINQLLEAQIIRESCSPYASPIVLVRKKDGSLRLCVEYRQLNQKTRKDAFPLPRIEESLDALSGANWFSTLDLVSGYNQVPVAEKDKAKTAFCTPFGLFEFNRMPFGLCNAPSTFQRLMQRLFGEQHCQSLLLYLDDVVVFSSSISQHLERLEGVLEGVAGSSPSSVRSQIDALDLSDLSREEAQRVRTLLVEYQAVFSAHEGDLGCTSLISHEIPLLDDVPVRQRYRRLPPSEYEVVKAHINQLLEAQIIRESCSPYASPIVLVRKKDGSLRLCVDYRQLNQKTRKDAFPLPRIEESLDALSGANWFSTLDLVSGYNQVPVAEKDKAKTAFCTPFGLFEFNRMPFGLCNAPSTFQRLMQRLFGEQHCQSLLLYLDDVVVFSSSISQHLERLEGVLSRLGQEGLKAKLEKCTFFKQEVGYLGHVISSAGVSTDPGKIEAVAQWRRPTQVAELRSFLGFTSYYRRFVEGFAKMAAPLHKLVAELVGTKARKRTGRDFAAAWTEACEQSFEGLKAKLTSTPVLAYANFALPFILEVDASHSGLGAVLSQEQDGKVRPIAYASRGLARW
ncbi:uncharacterized protein LOC130086512 [Rhinichthys klamathensis goyatoka]|uniref:uncharacterized protein LOC130086512 n=1 Tax=Rhinichthys klamathensis goyatoka TaxID=3034132 RepID=UPI0024B553B6|nr:uncharacterized protein LOC130086512 [Rhinichthys klamathensis goyatoka]